MGAFPPPSTFILRTVSNGCCLVSAAPSTSGGVGACVGAVLLKNSTPSATISFQQQIFIAGMHSGSVTLKKTSSMFQTAKAPGVRREKKKKKTGQSFESVSDRLGQLSVYINKLEF